MTRINVGIPVEKLTKSHVIAEHREIKRIPNCISKEEANREGYVLRFWPSNKRVKIKFNEYVRLHRLLTGFSNIDIWEYLKDGKDVNELLENVPDEFDKWVKDTISSLHYDCYRYREYCGKVHDYFRFGKYGDKEVEPTRKEYAEHLKNNINPKLHGIMWAMWDGNGNKEAEIIWKMVRPKYQKPFWNQEDTEINNQTKLSKFND